MYIWPKSITATTSYPSTLTWYRCSLYIASLLFWSKTDLLVIIMSKVVLIWIKIAPWLYSTILQMEIGQKLHTTSAYNSFTALSEDIFCWIVMSVILGDNKTWLLSLQSLWGDYKMRMCLVDWTELCQHRTICRNLIINDIISIHWPIINSSGVFFISSLS